MTSSKKKSRLGLAVITAVLSLASIFALATPASAITTPLPPVFNGAPQGGVNKITVSWLPAVQLDPADNPNEYIIQVKKLTDPGAGTVKVVTEPFDINKTSYTVVIDDLSPGTWEVLIVARNNAPLGQDLSAPITANAVVTGVPVIINTAPWRPFPSWDALIKAEYLNWTGCAAKDSVPGAAPAGRLPRLDELTFWRYELGTKPLTTAEADQLRYASYTGTLPDGSTQVLPSLYKQGILNSMLRTNKPQNGLISEAQVDAMKAAFDALPTNTPSTDILLTYTPNNPPLTGDRVAADTNVNGAGVVVGDGKISYGEFKAADSASLAAAQYEVYYQRRMKMVFTLAEGAEQTDGPAIRLYTAFFKRDPDPGACYWSNQLKSSKMSLLSISNFFVNSSEFVNTYGAYTTDADEPGTDAAEFVALIYANVLDRNPDGAGAAYWTRQLQSQRKSPAEVMVGFSESPEFKNKRALSVATNMAYIHLLGRTPSKQELAYASQNLLSMSTSQECGWSYWGCGSEWLTSSHVYYLFGWNNIYTYLIDKPEYLAHATASPTPAP